MASDPGRRPPRRETREVVVEEPGLSAATNRRLTEDVRDAVGASRVQVPAQRAHPSRGDSVEGPRPGEHLIPRNFMVSVIAAAGIVGGAILALITGAWWVLPLVVLVLFSATFAVTKLVLRMTANPERPEPSTVAAMEEEGIADPERHFSALVDEFTEDRGQAGTQGRTAEADADSARAAAEHRDATTPSGGPTRPVGPGHGSGRPQRRRRTAHSRT